eukprot:380153-Amorphochlora_amoeboformis.AAC.1
MDIHISPSKNIVPGHLHGKGYRTIRVSPYGTRRNHQLCTWRKVNRAGCDHEGTRKIRVQRERLSRDNDVPITIRCTRRRSIACRFCEHMDIQVLDERRSAGAAVRNTKRFRAIGSGTLEGQSTGAEQDVDDATHWELGHRFGREAGQEGKGGHRVSFIKYGTHEPSGHTVILTDPCAAQTPTFASTVVGVKTGLPDSTVYAAEMHSNAEARHTPSKHRTSESAHVGTTASALQSAGLVRHDPSPQTMGEAAGQTVLLEGQEATSAAQLNTGGQSSTVAAQEKSAQRTGALFEHTVVAEHACDKTVLEIRVLSATVSPEDVSNSWYLAHEPSAHR